MNTAYKYVSYFSAFLLCAGCIQEEVAEEFSVDIKAVMEAEPPTRTVLSRPENGMYYPLWSAGDEIAVYADDDAEPSKFSLVSGEGSTVATFSGTRKGTDYFAVYPYDIAGPITDGTLSLTLPGIQKYVKDSFGPGAFPMLATGSSDGGLTFMNLCSVLKISLTGSAAIKSITLTAHDKNAYLSGPAAVCVAFDDEPELLMSSGGSHTIELEAKGTELSADSPTDFYIVVPAQTYKGGLTVTIDAYNDIITKEITSDLTFERSQIRHLKGIELQMEAPDIVADAVPDDEIWYITSDGSPLVLNKAHEWWGYPETDFGAEVISNKYVDGKGVLKFDAPVTKIGEYAFKSNYSLKEMYIPDLVKSIGGDAFYDCVELESLHLPDDLESVGTMAFWNCAKLTEFNTELASQDKKCLIIDSKIVGFAQHQIVEYTTPDGVESIADYAFANMRSLKKITVSEGVKLIGNEAFSANDGVASLEEVYLPSTLECLGAYAFLFQKNIKAFYGNNGFVSDDNMFLAVQNYNNMGYNTMVAFASASDVTEYTIPEGVQAIESYGCYYAKSLTKLNFPDSFETIFSGHAFEGTTNIETITGKYVIEDGRSMVKDGVLIFVAGGGLESYTTPEGVTHLCDMVLGFNDGLKELVVSDEVETFDGYGYIFNYNPSLETVTISTRMTSLGYDPFRSDSYCTPSLKTVYCRALIPPIIYYNTDITNPCYEFDDLTIYVPKEAYDMYLSSAFWDIYERYLQPYDYGDLSEFYPDYYVSTDYSQDGVVKPLQTATVGNGIDIVLMGDAYSDRQIADGTYEADMKYMYDNLFTQEPFKTHKDMFNVYYVNVVSSTEGYENSGSALGGYFGEGTLVGGNDNAAFNYALGAVTEDRMDETLIIIAMNSDAYAGTCYMYYPGSATGTYGSGPSVAYFPKGGDQTVFAQLLHHEANGHGFAKLADEYAYEEMGAAPSGYVSQTKEQQDNWGWWKNVDFTSDPEQVRWSYFLDDERYADEGLGAFEGGLTYWTGVWRPTENSIMRYNTGGFNAPSREAIYYRIHKLAYGDAWEYDYEDFVEYDAVNRPSSSSAPRKSRRNYVERPLEPTSAPVVVGKSWRDADTAKN